MPLPPDSLNRLLSPGGIICRCAAETGALGKLVADRLMKGAVLSLDGPLGAGKTRFVRGLVEALGCAVAASSPSFALVHEYSGGRLPVFHFDFYRIRDVNELLTAGLDDCLPEGVTIAEWGGKFPDVFPADTLWFRFEILPEDGGRRITADRLP